MLNPISKELIVSRSRRASDKSMQDWHGKTADGKAIDALIGNDFSQGHRGMARSVKGAKKFVRSRVRFANKMQLRRGDLNED